MERQKKIKYGLEHLTPEVIEKLKEGFKTPSVFDEFYTKQMEDRWRRWVEICDKRNKENERN